MLFDDTQSYTAFKSSCRLSQSVTSPTPEYSLVLSAKLTSLDADTSLSISEIIIKNRRGPKTVPCGTPLNTGWCCCCLPTPMTLASGGSPMFPHVVHQPASPSIWPAVQSLRRGLSTNPGVTMWCVCGCS